MQQVIATCADGALLHATDLDERRRRRYLGFIFDDKIAWYEKPGRRLLRRATGDHDLRERRGQCVRHGLDGDDDAGVLSASYIDGKIAWYENSPVGADALGECQLRGWCVTRDQQGFES